MALSNENQEFAHCAAWCASGALLLENHFLASVGDMPNASLKLREK